MKASFYVTVGAKKARWNNGGDMELDTLSVRKNKPNSVGKNEITVKINLEVPDALFQKPTLEVSASVPGDLGNGPTITTEVADNIAQIIQEQTGLTVRIEAADDEPED